MGIEQEYAVYCDGDEGFCGEPFHSRFASEASAIKSEARAKGWVFPGRLADEAFCPVCAEQRKREKKGG